MSDDDRAGDYDEALDYLYGFANFEHRRIDQYTADHMDPERPARLLRLMGDPQRQFPAIHIAGTKGKGSVAAMCAACLREAGLRTGLYTSPHLQEFRDRLRILTPDELDGRISRQQLVTLVQELKQAAPQVEGLTWFELVTALAFAHFARQRVDAAVVEVGLGGRLDATNVITPLVSAITSLSLDHTQLLGDTLVEIAGEKAGIVKPGVPVVIAPQAPEALARLANMAAARQAPFILVGRDWQYVGSDDHGPGQTIIITRSADQALIPPGASFTLALAGRHQQQNAAVAVAALAETWRHLPGLSLAVVARGLATVTWPGRLQVIHQADGQPTVLVDAAHNEDSAEKLAYALQQDYPHRALWLVFGATADKNVAAIMRRLLPLARGTFVTTSGHPRAAGPADLARLAGELGFAAQPASGVAAAFAAAWRAAAAGDLICVTGSIFIVGDLLNQWDSLQSGYVGHGGQG